ncbi:lytic transglycosylase domain-containing protein [Spirosoma sp.]|uniref:lytic transglycosylase domain-containing protein n=1 Tax=Spirosoma sp. TaxID=1899569 RepID=UPI00262B7012|nr:lytic transglycosylase domain-containing protein [Spirosoma sp.]MCX6218725.1 lytic transglycosylase domain-containing protein [Spirosoma sp.]
MNLLASLVLATVLVLASVSSPYTLNTLPSPATPTIDPVLKTMLPPVYFCGESVPVHEEVVARRLVSALVRNTSQNQAFLRIRQRAAVFFPVIEPILLSHSIPLDFKYLPLVESALQGFAVSPKGAAGYWQFMPATARELGLNIERGVDERQHLIKSTHAACRYLRYLHNRLGSWTLAAAAYNNGIGALLSNIRRQQQRDYYYLHLNAETGKYLYRILAFKELFTNYRSYQHLIPERMMANLTSPLNTLTDDAAAEDEILIPEVILNEATQEAINTPINDPLRPAKGQSMDIPLPNAADVFRGGIKAKLVEPSGLERGQIWVFHLTRDGIAGGHDVEEGDILYAVIEDIDTKTNKVYLRSDKLYSTSERQTYSLALSAVDASTGRIGINLSDLSQLKSGWILTWKSL